MLRTMKSVLVLLLLASCGNNSDGAGKGDKNAAAFETGIDTTKLNSAEALLNAARQFKEVKTKDEQQKKADAGYQDHYLELLKLETLLTNKATEMMGKLPAGESIPFYDKFKAAMK
jgi:hypothetical protein